ncbi:MAG: acetyltransferase, ribosomal protein N-acetylase, partial [Frankiales bacterium]|nr:acetyltransferase, ribosomal protein N-acetylase [Frankiales bacterium]
GAGRPGPERARAGPHGASPSADPRTSTVLRHMTRLVGPRVALVPVPQEVAAAVLAGEAAPLATWGLTAGRGWPHADTLDAVREAAGPGQAAGTWLITLDGAVIGDCGWRGPPDVDGLVEIGYGLAHASQGQGLGTEAVAVLAAWVEQQPGVRLLTAEVLPGNEPSLRLLARLGFVEHQSATPYLRYVLPAPGEPRPRGRHLC